MVRICAGRGVPVIPFGAGTSFEGSVNAPFGGVSIDFRDMNRVLAVHAGRLRLRRSSPASPETGSTSTCSDQGLFFPVDPGADASLGGMASTRASGTTAVRYGTMKDNVLALKVVLPDGALMTTSRRARKSSAGYDLTRLIVGAEGTLGVITELTLKLHGIPEAIAAGVCPFPSIEAACDAAIAAIQGGIPVARVELLDEVQVRACNADARLGLPEVPMLFLEFHGTEAGVAEQSERFGEIARDLGGGPFEWATRPEERSRLWRARHHVFWADKSFRPGAHAIVTDVCVPISRLAECVTETKRDLERSGLVAPIVGHAGDGNFHCVLLVMIDDADGGRPRARLHRAHRGTSPADGGDLHRRACDRSRQDALPRTRARPGRGRRHARDQAGARSGRDHESGQDRLGDRLGAAIESARRRALTRCAWNTIDPYAFKMVSRRLPDRANAC